MNRMFFLWMTRLAAIALIALPLLTACNGDDDPAIEPKPADEYLYVLNNGNMNSNNASLTMYALKDSTTTKDIFEVRNKRGLGDTGQDIIVYGSKMYIAVFGESTIEVTDLDARSIKQISTAGQPRSLTYHANKVYVTYFNGYVARIDTASLEVEKTVQVGRNPEQMTVVNDKLYVANSGGLDYNTAIGYDKTVSVVDLNSFTEIKKLDVVINPNSIVSDGRRYAYVVSVGNYGDVPNTLQRIDATTDVVTTITDFRATELATAGDQLYSIHAQWGETASFYKYDMTSGNVASANFIGNTPIASPYRISADSASGEVYITSSDYVNDGDVYVFDGRQASGTLLFKFEAGLNPIKTVRVKK